MDTDRITLTVPAKGEYAKTVRLTAASLAGRMEMSYDDVDDVRIAAEEAFVYAAETLSEGQDVEMHFILDGRIMRIEVPLGHGSPMHTEDDERAASYATFILQSVCDGFELASDEQGTWLRLEKRGSLVTVDDE